jgi:hypothetical protein
MKDPNSSSEDTENPQQSYDSDYLDSTTADALEDLFGEQDLEAEMEIIQTNEDKVRDQDSLL